MLCNMYGDFMFCRKKSNIVATFLTDKMLDYIIKKKLASVLVELLDTFSPGLFVYSFCHCLILRISIYSLQKN